MLRVEASNLPSPRARSRRLHASAPPPPQVRHEILPPPADALEPSAAATPLPSSSSKDGRWSVRVELQDKDVAKLYGQGLARGALVWKRGMREWRPLLIVPELTSLLRRTRVALSELARPEQADEITQPRLPAPAQVPSDVALSYEDSGRRIPITVSPTAIDVPPPAPSAPRRLYEIGGAALAGFALAWLIHSGAAPEAPAAPPATFAAAAPLTASPLVAPIAPAVTAASTIPLVALSDLPLVGAQGTIQASARSVGDSAPARARAHGDGPSRSELLAALSRVAGAASGCGERGGPVRVLVTFGASGVARGIQVSGKQLPSSTRSCIIGAASRARVPAFAGAPVTVGKTL